MLSLVQSKNAGLGLHWKAPWLIEFEADLLGGKESGEGNSGFKVDNEN